MPAQIKTSVHLTEDALYVDLKGDPFALVEFIAHWNRIMVAHPTLKQDTCPRFYDGAFSIKIVTLACEYGIYTLIRDTLDSLRLDCDHVETDVYMANVYGEFSLVQLKLDMPDSKESQIVIADSLVLRDVTPFNPLSEIFSQIKTMIF